MPPRKLSQNDLIVGLQEIDDLPIDAASKRALKDILRQLANADSDSLETIIKTLPKAQQRDIYRIFDEIAARQRAQADEASKNLVLLGLLTLGGLLSAYLLSPTQEALQSAQLLEIMRQAYLQGIQDEIDYCGCNARARYPSGEQLAYLQALADRDAASIIETFNKDSAKHLVDLYQENPNASKDFFVQSMKAWADKRAEWKSLSIAFNTQTNAREYARAQFAAHNYPDTAKYKFKGSIPAVCPDCRERFLAGEVDYDYTLKYPCPRHPHCEHRWQINRKPKVDCQSLWIG